jgi:hypothetical protein
MSVGSPLPGVKQKSAAASTSANDPKPEVGPSPAAARYALMRKAELSILGVFLDRRAREATTCSGAGGGRRRV